MVSLMEFLIQSLGGEQRRILAANRCRALGQTEEMRVPCFGSLRETVGDWRNRYCGR